MSQIHLAERSATGGLWRVVQQWPGGHPLLSGPRTRCSYVKEPASTSRDAFGAYCWQRYPGGPIFYSDPAGEMIGSVDSFETLYAYGFTRAFGEPIESGTDPIEPVPSKSQS